MNFQSSRVSKKLFFLLQKRERERESESESGVWLDYHSNNDITIYHVILDSDVSQSESPNKKPISKHECSLTVKKRRKDEKEIQGTKRHSQVCKTWSHLETAANQ